MSTKLLKTVKREMLYTAIEFGKYRGRGLIVEILPPDIIRFRIKGTQQAFEMPMVHALRLAEMFSTNDKYREALEMYNLKRKAGAKRLRRPKKVNYPYAKMYYNVFK